MCGEGVIAATMPLSRQEGQLSVCVCVCVGLQGALGARQLLHSNWGVGQGRRVGKEAGRFME